MEQREWKEAEDTFKELRSEPANKSDTYACLAQGAIPLNSLSGRRKVGLAELPHLRSLTARSAQLTVCQTC